MNLSEHRQDIRFKAYIGLFHALPFVLRLINTLLKHTQHRYTSIYRQELKWQTRISSGWNLLQLARCNWYCRTRYERWNKLRTEVAKSVTKGSFSWSLFSEDAVWQIPSLKLSVFLFSRRKFTILSWRSNQQLLAERTGAQGSHDKQTWKVFMLHSALRSRNLSKEVICVHIQLNRNFKWPSTATVDVNKVDQKYMVTSGICS
jgi:hypothetical protein